MPRKSAERTPRGPRSHEQKLAALHDFDNRQRLNMTALAVAEKHGVSEPTLYYWVRQRDAGELAPKKPGPKKSSEGSTVLVMTGNRTAPMLTGNRTAPDVIRAAVAAYENRGEKSAFDIAQEFGVKVDNLYKWAERHRGDSKSNGHSNGNGNGHAITVRRQQSLTVEEHAPEVPLELEAAMLRTRNLKLRKVIALLIEDL